MNVETDILEELERHNLMFYIRRGEVFQKGEVVAYDAAHNRVVRPGTPGSMRLGTVDFYIPPEIGKPRSKPILGVYVDNDEVLEVIK